MTHAYRIDPERRWENRQLIHEPDPRRWRRLALGMAVVAVAFAPTIAYLWQQNECLRVSYRISELRQRQDELIESQRRLRFEGAARESLEDVESWARDERGLVFAGPDRAVVVSPEAGPRSALLARGR
jgi:hypothetical protein